MSVSRLAATFVLADKLRDIAAANMIIDEFIHQVDESGESPHWSVIHDVVNTLPLGSPLCRLLIDYFVYDLNSFHLSGLLNNDLLPKYFCYSVLDEKTRLLEAYRDKKVHKIFCTSYVNRNKCRYHQHNDQHPMCADTQAAAAVAKTES